MKRTKKSKLLADELGWKEVAMPDRLDDVEGFFGLEEIEGIDVVADEAGKLQFKSVDKSKKAKKTKVPPAPPKPADDDTEAEDDEEEWGGIIDTEAESTEEEAATKPIAAKPQSEKKKKQKKDAKAKDKKVQQQAAKSNPFETLLEDRLDDSDEDVDLPEWETLDLSFPTLRALAKLKFASPTAIQSAAIPKILAGHDLIGKASTGSGKTLAFGIPILETYLKSSAAAVEVINTDASKNKIEKLPIALVLSPTRELAKQLSDHLMAVAAFVPDFKVVTLTGGLSLQKQQRLLDQGVDVIVATPGRLWEVVSEGIGWIDKLKRGLRFLVVDEADRLLQEGHYKEVEDTLNLLQREEYESGAEDDGSGSEDGDMDAAEFKKKNKPKKKKAPAPKRQTLVFSATFHQGLQQRLAAKGKKSWPKNGTGGDLLDNKESMEYLLKKLNFREESPQFVDANPAGQMATNLREGIIECGAMEKDLYLYYLLLRYPCRTLVFTNSISSVKRLTPFLSQLQLPANSLHSNMIQKARLRSLERFSSPSSPNSILIATDVAARGLDIKGVEMIVHYHLPRTADMYVHRSGRTARSDARGISILLCAPEEVMGVRRLVSKVHEGDNAKSTGKYAMKSFSVDRKLVDRLKRRATLSKKIADSTVEKAKKNKEDDWLKTAADELGVEYDSEEFNSLKVGKKGQRGKQKREKAASASKDDIEAWKAELKALLKQKINSGFSERYLTSGIVNIASALMNGEAMHDNIIGVEKKSVIDEVTW